MNRQVTIENGIDSQVSISIPEIGLKRFWERKGVKKAVDFEKLQEAIYDPGVEYMFNEGILIAEPEVMKELGFSEELLGDTKKILNDFQRKRYMTVMPLEEFKKEVNELSFEQLNALADFAIENKYLDIEKSDILKDLIGRDIVKTSILEKKAQED